MEKLRFMSINRFLCIIILGVSLVSCKSEYQQYVEEEMATGITNDSLIFDMRMGLTKKEFYSLCWDLNSKGLVRQGPGNQYALYTTDRDTAGNATEVSKEMLFFGIFDEDDVMRGMDMIYSYYAWAIWNEDKQADSLLMNLRDEYLQGYPGNDFIEIDIKESDSPALVKIDGNRQILIYAKNKKDVAVKIEDLNYKLNKQWKKE